MKADEALKHDVEQELAWDLALDASGIDVDVREGIVTLSGQVPDYAQKLAAGLAAERVAGCRAIALALEVAPPPDAGYADADLANALMVALRWQAGLTGDRVRAEVERGFVTLLGEVDWGYQRHAAEQVVDRMRGVVGVANLITVRNSDAVFEVAQHISAALARRAQREFAGIHIDVNNGVVTLSGTVSSLPERRAACGAAWATRGVRAVVDQLTVE
jgi:osmotically-inducible protein OsmY